MRLPARPLAGRRRCRRAFTLIEVLAVVVILGIASVAILPQIATRDDQRAASAARVLMSDLLYAQNRAVAQQRVHFVQFDAAAQTYKVLDALTPASVIKHPVDGSTYVVKFGPASTAGLAQMQLASAGFDGQPVLAFDVMGIPQSVNPATGTMTPLTAGSVVVRSGVFSLTVTVSPYSGELTVQ
jgi:prepilin-type N-terminal cleavage/methylation domain-containing protein